MQAILVYILIPEGCITRKKREVKFLFKYSRFCFKDALFMLTEDETSLVRSLGSEHKLLDRNGVSFVVATLIFRQGKSQGETLHTIKIVSQNVLFTMSGDYDKDPTFPALRVPRILASLEETDADFIALQEVEPQFYNLLRDQSW